MGIARLSFAARRTAIAVPTAIALSGCATAGSASTAAVTAAHRDAVAGAGPRARIWTTDEFGSGSRIRTSFRLDDDAYVAVVNVGLDGYAHIVFPASPDDDGFVRGDRTYRLPGFFPGFARHFGSRYGRLYTATSAYDDLYDRYAGYVILIASWRPMRFREAEELGLWDEYRLAVHEQQLEPYVVMDQFAAQLVGGGRRDYTARYARYAAYGGGFARRAYSSAHCSLYGSAIGHFPWSMLTSVGQWWMPVYGGFRYRGGNAACGFGARLALVRLRGELPGTIVRPPVRPTPTPAPGPGDTATRPPRKRDGTPVAGGDSAERKSQPRRRVTEREADEETVDEETVMDLTKETRRFARLRKREAALIERAPRAERGTTGTGRVRWTSPRHRPRAEPRSSEPRAEPRREPAPRSEPVRRSDPPPRSEPTPRSEPASRAEPRGERPVKPPDHQ